jgi:ABC-2 type transport system permease protein
MIPFTKFEIVRTFRNSKFLMFLVAMPVGLYLVFTMVKVGDSSGISEQDGYLQTMIAMAVYAATASAMYATGPELAQERASGWIRQVLVTPLSFASWMGAKVIQGLVLTIPGTAAVAVVAAVVHGVNMPVGHWALLVVVVVIGSIPFALLGQIIGQLLKNQSASAGQLFILFGLSFLGGLFLPYSTLPASVQQIGRFTPTYHLVEACREVVAGQAVAWTHPAAIAISAVVIGVVVLGLWRRDGATG